VSAHRGLLRGAAAPRAGERGAWARVRDKGGLANLARILLGLAWGRLASAAHVAWLRVRGVRVGRGVRVHGPVRILGDPRRVVVGDGCSLHGGVRLWTHDYGPGHGRIVLGARVTLLTGVCINSFVGVFVGDDAAFGDGCYVQDNDHGTAPGVPVMRQPSHGLPIVVGRDVWLGARCIVLKGVTIGDGTVVGAGSVVVKPLPAGVVAVGVPARPVRRRGGGAIEAGRAA
jgi:acetyltransferase-like isoleucine patch superfamily enzyme